MDVRDPHLYLLAVFTFGFITSYRGSLYSAKHYARVGWTSILFLMACAFFVGALLVAHDWWIAR